MFTHPPDKILLQLGPLVVHWYGLLVVLGFLAGLMVLIKLFAKYKLKPDDAYSLFFYTIIFGLLGARIYYVAYAWSYYSQNLIDIVKVWQGGLAIHGAIIAAILTIYFYSKRKGWSAWLITDLVATAVPLSLAIGRWGNYFNQELFGKPTQSIWGIPIETVNRPAGYLEYSYFHPTFLYESLLDLGLFLLLLLLHRRRLRGGKSEIGNRKSGNITLIFLAGYSVIRFLMEFLRLDYSPMFLGMRWAQLLSLVVMAGVVVFWLIRKKLVK